LKVGDAGGGLTARLHQISTQEKAEYSAQSELICTWMASACPTFDVSCHPSGVEL
jgi:hypothetical protein